MEYAQAIPSLSQAQRIRQLSKEKQLSLEKMEEIMCEVKKGEITREAFTNEHMISSIFSSDNCFSLLICRILWACESDGIACAYSIATSSSFCSFSLNAAISTAGQKESWES